MCQYSRGFMGSGSEGDTDLQISPLFTTWLCFPTRAGRYHQGLETILKPEQPIFQLEASARVE